jgi:hypothetical protein
VSAPLACGLTWCGKSPARFFVIGARCRDHTPSAQAGVPEPDELLARHRAALAGTNPTTERTPA